MTKTEQKKDKMVKPTQSVRAFNFPHFGVTVQAVNIIDAQKELKKHLDSNTQKND